MVSQQQLEPQVQEPQAWVLQPLESVLAQPVQRERLQGP